MSNTEKDTVEFICPRCWVKYKFEPWELKEDKPKCVYCNGPLERIGGK